jgi:hypothetical protein
MRRVTHEALAATVPNRCCTHRSQHATRRSLQLRPALLQQPPSHAAPAATVRSIQRCQPSACVAVPPSASGLRPCQFQAALTALISRCSRSPCPVLRLLHNRCHAPFPQQQAAHATTFPRCYCTRRPRRKTRLRPQPPPVSCATPAALQRPLRATTTASYTGCSGSHDL